MTWAREKTRDLFVRVDLRIAWRLRGKREGEALQPLPVKHPV
jgi:hypothetical protein